MLKDFFDIFDKLEILDNEMQAGNFDNVQQYYYLQEKILGECDKMLNKLPADYRIGYDKSKLYEVIRIIYILQKNGSNLVSNC